ncbi:MAG: hypothetical protein E7535_09430 [Ruminococcaceae bacterium]|nr:hypothetical protein [Oscillospiraceae bacterium]
MTGIIPAAGDGDRLRDSLGIDCCKSLIKINNRCLIEYSLENFLRLGVRDVYIVVGKYADEIKKTVGEEYCGMKIKYVLQKQRKGIVNAIVTALDETGCGDTVILQLADEILAGFKAEAVTEFIEDGVYDFCCGITYEDDADAVRKNYSVETDGTDRLKKCTEKPDFVGNNMKGTGFCIFRSGTLMLLKDIYDENTGFPRELCDYMNYLVSVGKTGRIFEIAEKEFNINTAEELNEAKKYYS